MASQNTGKLKKVFGITGAVLFFLSYLPLFYLIAVGIEGRLSGLFGGPLLYGFDAMWNYFTWLCIVPIYPACIIYQLIFGIVYIRKHRILNYAAIGVVFVLVTAITVVGLTAENKNEKRLAAAKPLIEQYLTDKYGEGFITENTRIRLFSPDEDGYMVTTDVLPDGIEFAVYLSAGNDTLIDSFCNYNDDFRKEFEDYASEQCGIPDNMSLQVNIESVEFGSYHLGDDYTDLFPRVDYSIGGLTVDLDNANDDSVEELIYEVWEEQFPEFEDKSDSDYITMYVRDNGEYAYSVVYYIDSRTAAVSLYRPTDRVSELDNVSLELP